MNGKLLSRTFVVLVLGALSLWMAPQAHAANQVVSDCGDNGGANQLRTKITEAQNSGGGTITFTCGPNVTLTGTVLPIITTNITINGGNTIILSGNSASRIFYVSSTGTLTLNNITLTKGSMNADGGAIRNQGTLNINTSKFMENQSTAASGGAIVSYGPLNITNSEFGYNKAVNGGAVYPRWSAAVTTITNSNFHHNEATDPNMGLGGAILAWDGSKVTIQGGTRFTNNKAQSGEGGAIFAYWNSTLLVQDSTVSENQAYYGGGIYSDSGADTTIQNSTVSNNYSESFGGGVYLGGKATLSNVTVSDNTALSGGGGVHTSGSPITMTDMTIRNNHTNDQGGGISSFGGSFTLQRSTVSGNTAYEGGGIQLAFTTAITNVTVSGNTATRGGGIVAHGSFNLTHVTLIGNSATEGGGIYADGFDEYGRLLKNSVIAESTSGGNCAVAASSGTITSAGFNLSSDNTCASYLINGTDYNNLNPLLGPLANNGGSTQTHLPQPLSPVIDHGSCTDTSGNAVTTDQRNIVRPQGTTCDIGAVEVEQAATPTRTPTKTATNPSPNTPTRTNTPIQTATWTATPTWTPTTPSCSGKPDKPTLLEPGNTQKVKGPRVNLDWSDAGCATSYGVIVKEGGIQGRTAFRKKSIDMSQVTTGVLLKGKTYYWQVTAKNANGSYKSDWWSFTVK